MPQKLYTSLEELVFNMSDAKAWRLQILICNETKQ